MSRILALIAMISFVSLALADSPLDKIESEVTAAIARQELPGAVVLVMHKNEIVYRQAFGLRSIEPDQQEMTVDTIFDLASLTKPIVTATSIFLLIEQGNHVAYVGEHGCAFRQAVWVTKLRKTCRPAAALFSG